MNSVLLCDVCWGSFDVFFPAPWAPVGCDAAHATLCPQTSAPYRSTPALQQPNLLQGSNAPRIQGGTAHVRTRKRTTRYATQSQTLHSTPSTTVPRMTVLVVLQEFIRRAQELLKASPDAMTAVQRMDAAADKVCIHMVYAPVSHLLQ